VEVAAFHPAESRALQEGTSPHPTHFFETLPPCGGEVRSAGHRRTRLCGPVPRLTADGD